VRLNFREVRVIGIILYLIEIKHPQSSIYKTKNYQAIKQKASSYKTKIRHPGGGILGFYLNP